MDRLVQKVNRRVRVTPDLYYALSLLIVVVMLGTIGFYLLEDWSPLEALYATAITITTVGYGDFVPIHGRAGCLPFSLWPRL